MTRHAPRFRSLPPSRPSRHLLRNALRRPLRRDPGQPGRGRPREPIDLGRYARLLAQHTRVVDSLAGTAVDYAALARSRDLDALVAQLKAARPSKLGHNARLAFWINAYNLLTLDLVRRHYPIESIKDIGSLFSPVWRKPLGEIEGAPITLDRIEHEILRKEGEPRIHAAIVCASQSCPPLLRRPFRAKTLDADLDEAMRRFLASKRKGVAIDRAAKTVRVSKIFQLVRGGFRGRRRCPRRDRGPPPAGRRELAAGAGPAGPDQLLRLRLGAQRSVNRVPSPTMA